MAAWKRSQPFNKTDSDVISNLFSIEYNRVFFFILIYFSIIVLRPITHSGAWLHILENVALVYLIYLITCVFLLLRVIHC